MEQKKEIKNVEKKKESPTKNAYKSDNKIT